MKYKTTPIGTHFKVNPSNTHFKANPLRQQERGTANVRMAHAPDPLKVTVKPLPRKPAEAQKPRKPAVRVTYNDPMIDRAFVAWYQRDSNNPYPSGTSSRREGNVVILANRHGVLARYRVVIRQGRECVRFIDPGI